MGEACAAGASAAASAAAEAAPIISRRLTLPLESDFMLAPRSGAGICKRPPRRAITYTARQRGRNARLPLCVPRRLWTMARQNRQHHGAGHDYGDDLNGEVVGAGGLAHVCNQDGRRRGAYSPG